MLIYVFVFLITSNNNDLFILIDIIVWRAESLTLNKYNLFALNYNWDSHDVAIKIERKEKKKSPFGHRYTLPEKMTKNV